VDPGGHLLGMPEVVQVVVDMVRATTPAGATVKGGRRGATGEGVRRADRGREPVAGEGVGPEVAWSECTDPEGGGAND
jgi:hypothetical protein